MDSHYEEFKDDATDDRIRFWLRESRTPEVLIGIGSEYPELLREVLRTRPLLAETLAASRTAFQQELHNEEAAERSADEAYWRPLKKELESHESMV